ncbi:MAG: hypothetical protein WDM84_03035 [Bauldia sp.]
MTGMLSHAELAALIGSIYDCALDPERWEDTLLRFRDAFTAQNAQLLLMDIGERRMTLAKSVGVTPEWLERQAHHQAELSRWPLLPEALALPPYEPQVSSRHFNPAAREASPYVREWARPQGLDDAMNIVIINSVSHLAALGMGRLATSGPFSDDEIELARLLSPHLRRAVTISKILDARAADGEMFAGTFDALRFGVVLVDDRRRILRSNRAGESMLEAGHLISSIGGVLQANLAAAVEELRAAITLAAEDEAGIGATGLAIRLTRSGEPPVLAHVLPSGAAAARRTPPRPFSSAGRRSTAPTRWRLPTT